MSAPPDARPYQGTVPPNIVRGSGVVSRGQLTQEAAQQQQLAALEEKRRQQVAAIAASKRRRGRNPQSATERIKAEQEQKDQARAQKKAEVAQTFKIFKEQVKPAGKAQGVDVNQATFKITSNQIKVSGLKGTPTKEARAKAEREQVNRIIDKQIGGLKARGANVNGATIKVSRTPTGNFGIETRGVSLPGAGVVFGETYNSQTENPYENPYYNTKFGGRRIGDLISEELKKPKGGIYGQSREVIDSKALKDYFADYERYFEAKENEKNYVYFQPDVTNPFNIQKLPKTGGSKDLELPGGFKQRFTYQPGQDVIKVEDLTKVEDNFKPGVLEQLYRGTVTYGAEFVGGVANIFNYAPISQEQKDRGNANIAAFKKAFGVNEAHPVYGGFSGLVSGLGAGFGSKEAQAQLVEQKKAFEQRPIEFAAASAVDIGVSLLGLKGAKPTFGAVGKGASSVKYVAARTYRSLTGAKGQPEILSIKETVETPAQYAARIRQAQNSIPQQVGLTRRETRDVELFKEFEGRNTAAYRKSISIQKAAKDAEKVKNPLTSFFAPKEPKTKGGGTFKIFKSKDIGGGNISSGSSGRYKTLTEPKLDKEQKQFEKRLKEQSQKEAKKIVGQGNIFLPETKEAIKGPGISGTKYSKPSNPLGFGGYSGLDLVRRKRSKEASNNDLETLFFTTPKENVKLKGMISLKGDLDLGTRQGSRAAQGNLSKLKIENLLSNKLFTGPKVNTRAKGNLGSLSVTKEGLGFKQVTGQATRTQQKALLKLELPTLQVPKLDIPTIRQPRERPPRITKEKPPIIPRLEFKFAGGYRKPHGGKKSRKGKRIKTEFEVKDLVSASLGVNSPFAKAFRKQFGNAF